MSEYDRAGRKFETWGEKEVGRFTDHPILNSIKWLVIIGCIGLVITVIGGVFGFIGDWGSEGKRIVSPTNVKEQHTQIIGDWEAMTAAAQNACDAEGAAQGDPDRAPSILESPTVAYNGVYRKARADYNRRQDNLFEAKLVGPKGYPRDAPTLEEMQAEVC